VDVVVVVVEPDTQVARAVAVAVEWNETVLRPPPDPASVADLDPAPGARDGPSIIGDENESGFDHLKSCLSAC
jgi:hypothetical protein